MPDEERPQDERQQDDTVYGTPLPEFYGGVDDDEAARVPEQPPLESHPRQVWESREQKAWARSARRKARLGKPIPPPPMETRGDASASPPTGMEEQPAAFQSVAPPQETGITSRTETGWEPQPESVQMPEPPRPAPEPPEPPPAPDRTASPSVPIAPETTPQGAPEAGEGASPPAPATTPPAQEAPSPAGVAMPIPNYDPSQSHVQAIPIPNYDPSQSSVSPQTLPWIPPTTQTTPKPTPQEQLYREGRGVRPPPDMPPASADEQPQFETVPAEDWPQFTPPPTTKAAGGPDENQPHFAVPPDEWAQQFANAPVQGMRPPGGERTRENRVGASPLGFADENGDIQPMKGPADTESPAPAPPIPSDYEWATPPAPPFTPPATMPQPGATPGVQPDYPATVPPPPETPTTEQSSGQGDKLQAVVEKLEAILESLNGIQEATTQNATAIAALTSKIDQLGTYG